MSEPKFYRAVIYARRSAEAGETSVSLPQQVRSCREYAKLKGAYVVDVVEHNGVSGGNPERFIKLHERLEGASANMLIVFSQDRLSRELESWLHWLRAWSKQGIEVHAVDRGLIEIDTTQGFLTNTLEQAFHELYRRQISEKMRASHEYRASLGKKSSGHTPYGYSKGTGGYLRIDDYEQKVIARARELRKQGLGYTRISKQLFAEGFTSRTGTRLTKKTLRKVINGDHPAHERILERSNTDTANNDWPFWKTKGYKERQRKKRFTRLHSR